MLKPREFDLFAGPALTGLASDNESALAKTLRSLSRFSSAV